MILYSSEVETQMQRHQRIENADGIVGGDLAQFLELAVAKLEHGQALHFSHRIVHHHQALVPSRRKCSAGGVREMVTYRMNVLGTKTGERLVHLPDQRFLRENSLVEPRGIGIERVKRLKRRVIEAVGDLIHVFDVETRLAKTKVNCVDREIAGVLLAAKAF